MSTLPQSTAEATDVVTTLPTGVNSHCREEDDTENKEREPT